MKILLRKILILALVLPQMAYSLVGSKRAGKGWEAIVYIEFFYSAKSFKSNCTGFLINESQVVTAGHCAIHDESHKKAKTATVCIGIQKPFSNPGEGCFQSSRIRFAKNYGYNTPSDMVIIDLEESIPLNFLGIKPIKIMPAKRSLEFYKNPTKLNQQNIRIISFGSRNFSSPSLGKKGWAKVSKMHWNKIHGIWQADVKGTVYGQADDGAGLLIKTPSSWMLAGLLLKSTPDFFVSVLPLFDPCLPPEPAPRQPDIKITSLFNFVSLNTIACSNKFFRKNLRAEQFCKLKPMSHQQMVSKKDASDKGGEIAFQLYLESNKLSYQLKWLNLAARRGHPKAMIKLSEHYFNGDGLRVNKAKSIQLVEAAAKLSFAEAQYRIALRLKNTPTASTTKLKGGWLQWIKKAAEQGHAASQFEYSQYLALKNSSQSYNWLMRAARQGFAEAQYQLGYNFYYGHGVKKDSYIGKQWIDNAAGQGHQAASEFIRRHPIQNSIEY